ncbi:MAG: hypothetical protein R3C12_15625 [Planctomycetaceae bacterium]
MLSALTLIVVLRLPRLLRLAFAQARSFQRARRGQPRRKHRLVVTPN